MVKKAICLEDYDKQIGSRMKNTVAGTQLLVDSGTIIEAENFHRSNSHIAAELLTRLNTSHPFIITKEVLEELALHNAFYFHQGKKEVSDKTMELIKNAYNHTLDSGLIQRAYLAQPDDSIRYGIWNTTQSIFKNDSRKGIKDPVSLTDRRLIEAAYLLPLLKEWKGKPLGVISTDSHVLKAIEELNKTEPYSGLGVFALDGTI